MLKKKRLLFLTGSFDGTGKEAAVLTSLLKIELQKYFIVNFISDNKECVIASKKRGIDIIYIYDELKKIEIKNLYQELTNFEHKYNFIAEKVLFGDVDYTYISREKALSEMLKMFYFWENFLKNEQYDLVFGGGVRYFGLIPELVIRKLNNTIFLGLTSSLFPHTFCLTSDNYGRYTLLDYYYKQKNKFSNLEMEDVNNLIQNYSKNIYSTVLQQEYIPKINWNKLKYLLDRILVSFIEGDSPYLNVQRGVKKYILRLLRKRFVHQYFYNTPNNEKFFYFPLQVHDDSNRLVWNNHIESQLSIINSISRALPADCYLYVKEHPGSIGDTSLKELISIKKIPKVRLISPFVPGRKLILDSYGLITLSGTSGIEALILKKQVIIFGRAYYDYPELVTHVRDVEQLDSIISSAYYNPKLPPEKSVLNLLKAYRKSCYPGIFGMRQYFYSNKVDNSETLSPLNARLLAEGIYHSYKVTLKIKHNLKVS